MQLNQRKFRRPGLPSARRVSFNLARRMARSLLAVLVCAQALLIAPPRALAETQPPISPMLQQYADWAAKPLRPAPGSPGAAALPPADAVPAASQPGIKGSVADERANFMVIQGVSGYLDNNWDIALYDISGLYNDRPTGYRLASDPADDYYPRLSYDFKQVVFVSERDGNPEVYRVGTDTTGVTRLTDSPAIDTRPAFSPDGSKVVFVSDRTGNPEIFVMNSDGSGITQLTGDPAVDTDPNWSPDGALITWVRRDNSGTAGSIFEMGADGSSPRVLYGPLAYPANPVWSPSGKFIGLQADANGDGWWDLMQIRSDGKAASVFPIYKDGTQDFQFGGWSGAESSILYVLARYEKIEDQWYLMHTFCDRFFPEETVYTGSVLNLNEYYFVSPDQRGVVPATVTPPNYPAPKSWIDPLPEWSYADGVPVTYHIVLGSSALKLYWVFIEYTYDPVSGVWSYLQSNGQEARQEQDGSFSGVMTIQSLQPGKTLYVRVKALDSANVWENTHAAPDTSTRLFDRAASGQVVDARGNPVAGARVVPSAPYEGLAPTDSTGRTSGHMLSAQSGTATFARDGFGTNPSKDFSGAASGGFTAVLPPQTNLLANGQFEATDSLTSGWQRSGTLPIEAEAGYSGWGSARLGRKCGNNLCTTVRQEDIFAASQQPLNNVALGADGSLHVLLRWNWKNQLPTYAKRDPGGTWSIFETVPLNSPMAWQSSLMISPDGAPGFINMDQYQIGPNAFSYVYRQPNGAWKVEPVGSGLGVDAAMERNGLLHIIYFQPGSTGAAAYNYYLWYRTRSTDGIWSDPVPVRTDPVCNRDNCPQLKGWIALTGNGTVHVVTVAYASSTIYPYIHYQLMPDGAFSAPELVPVPGDVNDVVGGPDGRLRLVTADGQRIWYAQRQPETGWDAPVLAYESNILTYGFRLQLDPRQNLHLVTFPFQGSHWVDLMMAAGSSTFQAVDIDGGGYLRSVASVTGADNRPLMLSEIVVDFINDRTAINELMLAEASTAEEASLSQTVLLPADMNRPTLSFLYKQNRGYIQSLNSGLRVYVTSEGGTPVLVGVDSQALGWQHGWADLTPWKGQRVTVTFQVEQAAGDPYVSANLDEITIGEWITPHVSGVIPAPVPAPYDPLDTVALSGENLEAVTRVWIAGQPVSAEYDAASSSLIASLPADLAPGRYDVRVENPDGLGSTTPGVLQVGLNAFVPFLSR